VSRAQTKAAAAAAGLLLALLLVSQAWEELPRRARTVAAFAPRELAVRRLGGSGTAFDRRYYSFLEGARRRLPASVAGVAIYGTPASDPHLHLATYVLAPRPVRLAPETLPPGWIAAYYGTVRPQGVPQLVEWEDGALVVPQP
jgi:hypothetical protein